MSDETSCALSGRTLGAFTLLDLIDEGGFGAAYRAKQDGLDRPVVVKVLHARAPAGAAMQRFVREAQLASRVDHPYAVHVYAFGVEDDGLLWIAMEHVHGLSLDRWIAAHGPMPLATFVPFFERVAQVVHAAHERGIVHRDLKPANIMVIEEAGELLPKLLDFGIAKLVDDVTSQEQAVQPSSRVLTDTLTPSSSTIGCPPYMAPELWTDPLTAGPAVDIYALGVIAFEALTGRRPYRAATAREFALRHLCAEIPAGPAPLRRALAKLPEERHESAVDLAAALRAEADAARRRARARRIGAVAAAVMVLIVFGAAQARAHYETRLAQQRAEDARHEAEATVTTAELEQGRAALLAQDYAGAQQHLGAAWEMGERSPATRFMLDRAQQPLRAELARLPAAHGRMWWASWSPDGRYIATTDDGGAQVWDGSTYGPLRTLPHGDTVYAGVWMSGGRLATACGDGSVRVWDVASGELVRELRLRGDVQTSKRPNVQGPRWARLASGGPWIAAVDASGRTAAVWDASTGYQLVEVDLGGGGWPAIAFSADTRWLAAGGGSAVAILDTATWLPAVRLGAQVHQLAWDPNGARLLTGSGAGDLAIWNVPGARPQHLRESGDQLDAVAFAPDGSRVAGALRNGTVLAFDATTGARISAAAQVHGKVISIEFSPDGARLSIAAANGLVSVSDVASGAGVALFDAPRNAAWTARFDPTSSRIIGATWDGAAWVWSAAAPYQRWTIEPLGEACGLIGDTDPDSRYLAVACVGHLTRVWDTARDTLLAELPALAPGDRVPYPIVSAAGNLAAIARGSAAELYELPGGRLVRAVRHVAPVTALAFGVGGELVSGDAAGAVLVTRPERDPIVLGPPRREGIDALAALPSGRIAAADTSGRVQILDGAGAVAATFAASVRARMLRPSIDGHRLLCVPSYAGPATPPVLLDLERGTTTQLSGPQVYAARWTAAGILTAHADGAARLWDAEGRLMRTLAGDRGFLADAALTDNGVVVGAGGDGALHFWDASTGRPLWKLAVQRRVLGVISAPWGIVTRDGGGGMSRWVLPDPRVVIDMGKDANILPFSGATVILPTKRGVP